MPWLRLVQYRWVPSTATAKRLCLALALDDGLGVAVPSRLARQMVPSPLVGPVEVAGVDRDPEGDGLAGDDGLGVAAVQVGLPDGARRPPKLVQ